MNRREVTPSFWTATTTTSERTLVNDQAGSITDEASNPNIISPCNPLRQPVPLSLLSDTELSVDVSARLAGCTAARLRCFFSWLSPHRAEMIVVLSTTANLILWGGSFIAILIGYLRKYLVCLHIISCLQTTIKLFVCGIAHRCEKLTVP